MADVTSAVRLIWAHSALPPFYCTLPALIGHFEL